MNVISHVLRAFDRDRKTTVVGVQSSEQQPGEHAHVGDAVGEGSGSSLGDGRRRHEPGNETDDGAAVTCIGTRHFNGCNRTGF